MLITRKKARKINIEWQKCILLFSYRKAENNEEFNFRMKMGRQEDLLIKNYFKIVSNLNRHSKINKY